MGIFETLLAFDDALVDWLIHASPKTDDDRLAMRRVFALRGDLEDALNDLVASRLKLAVADMPDEVARLNAASAAMTATAKTIDDVQTVLTAAGTAVSVAAKAATFVASV